MIGLDVHRDFCEVAVAEDGEVACSGRIPTTPAALELFGASLAPDDRVALEVTGGTCPRPPRPPGRRRRRRAQAREPVLVPARPRRGLRLRPAVADAQETAPARAHGRRSALPARDRHLGRQRGDAPGRARARRAGRDCLRPHRPRPARRGPVEAGRERDTGARITTAIKGQSRAADHKPLTSALRYVSHSRPHRVSHRRRSHGNST